MFEILILVPLYAVVSLVLGASITVGVLVFHVAVVPLVFKYSKTFRRHLVFANFVQWPLNVNYEDPSESGIEGGRNFTIEYESKVDKCSIKIGVWHILPKTLYEKLKGSFDGEADALNHLLDSELVDTKYPIVLYCHGYGDSTNVMPTENGVVEDSLIVYDWLNTTIEKSTSRPAVFVWGHSLGTGISSHLLGNLEQLSRDTLGRSAPLPPPRGLVLESAFNNLADEVKHHPLTALVSWLPYFRSSFVAPFVCNALHSFRSDDHLCRVRSLPLLLLHARDDAVVPHRVGEKLYEAVVRSRGAGGAAVQLHSYDKKENLGHKWICDAQDLPQVVGDFVSAHR